MLRSTVMGYVDVILGFFDAQFLAKPAMLHRPCKQHVQRSFLVVLFGAFRYGDTGIQTLFRYTPRIIELGGEPSYVCAACVVDA